MNAPVDPFEAQLGPLQEARLGSRHIHYRDRGGGRPVVFLHGLFLHGALWRNVVPRIEQPVRTIVPDLPFGGHRIPMPPDADLSPIGIADLVADFLDELELEDAVLVGNDTGGAVAQVMLARRPERVGALVLTPSDCFEYFPPPIFRILHLASRIPGANRAMLIGLSLPFVTNAPFGFGPLTKRGIPREIAKSYLGPGLRDRAVRRDFRKAMVAVGPRYTLEAAKQLPNFHKPALVIWPERNPIYPTELAERLARTLPDARLVKVDDSRTFMPEDQPDVLVRHLDEFLASLPAWEGGERTAEAKAN